MWQRFTNDATRVIHFAQEEATRLGTGVVGTEHLLIGLLREDNTVAARVLITSSVSLQRVRKELERQFAIQEGQAAGKRLTLSPKAKQALEYALLEAQELNPRFGLLDFVDTEHILLGLLREGQESGSKAFRILEAMHVNADGLRQDVLKHLGKVEDVTSSPIADRPDHRLPTDVWLNFTERAFRVMQLATEEAHRAGTEVVDLPHLAIALFRYNEAALMRQGVSVEKIRAKLLRSSPPGAATLSISPQLADAFGFAFQDAQKHLPSGLIQIEPVNLLQGFIEAAVTIDSQILEKIAKLGIDLDKIKEEL